MNYEDRTDLLPPEALLSPAVLTRLQRIPDAVGLIAVATSDPGSAAISLSAREAIARRVAEDTAPGRGAPEAAQAIEEDAMLCGYRFGRLALGTPLPGHPRLPVELQARADAMYLYDLVVWQAPAPDRGVPVAMILERHGQADGALEEAAAWAWVFGLGVALVEADLDTASDRIG